MQSLQLRGTPSRTKLGLNGKIHLRVTCISMGIAVYVCLVGKAEGAQGLYKPCMPLQSVQALHWVCTVSHYKLVKRSQSFVGGPQFVGPQFIVSTTVQSVLTASSTEWHSFTHCVDRHSYNPAAVGCQEIKGCTAWYCLLLMIERAVLLQLNQLQRILRESQSLQNNSWQLEAYLATNLMQLLGLSSTAVLSHVCQKVQRLCPELPLQAYPEPSPMQSQQAAHLLAESWHQKSQHLLSLTAAWAGQMQLRPKLVPLGRFWWVCVWQQAVLAVGLVACLHWPPIVWAKRLTRTHEQCTLQIRCVWWTAVQWGTKGAEMCFSMASVCKHVYLAADWGHPLLVQGQLQKRCFVCQHVELLLEAAPQVAELFVAEQQEQLLMWSMEDVALAASLCLVEGLAHLLHTAPPSRNMMVWLG